MGLVADIAPEDERARWIGVIGGGTAGTVAALAAARSGARTCLVERLGLLGGATVPGMVTTLSNQYVDANKNLIVGGIATLLKGFAGSTEGSRLGELLRKTGLPEPAVTLVRLWLDERPDNSEVLLDLARVVDAPIQPLVVDVPADAVDDRVLGPATDEEAGAPLGGKGPPVSPEAWPHQLLVGGDHEAVAEGGPELLPALEPLAEVAPGDLPQGVADVGHQAVDVGPGVGHVAGLQRQQVFLGLATETVLQYLDV